MKSQVFTLSSHLSFRSLFTFTDSVDRKLTFYNILLKEILIKTLEGKKKIQRERISNFSEFDSLLKGERRLVISVKSATASQCDEREVRQVKIEKRITRTH